ncbi:MAG TPA: hypothetical protein VF066_07720 [Thermoleophilaceae bacterium]
MIGASPADRQARNDVLQVLADIAILIWVWIGTGLVGFGPCGGDGGLPYAAPASPRGQACSLTGGVVLWVPITLLALSWLPFLSARPRVWITIAAALVPLAIIVLLGSLSPDCASGSTAGDCSHS